MALVFSIFRMILPVLLFALLMHLFRRFLYSTTSQRYWKEQRQSGNGGRRDGNGGNRDYAGGRAEGGFGSRSRRDPYVVLRCSPGDSDEVIKKRYRQLVSKYHPDRFIGLELDEEFVRLASERFEEVKQAYEEIRRVRGLA
ncbi:MAG: J domain-containing protein [Synergistales bacterium]|nr:J domain-containing protein [Synergistales bacterium]